MDTLAVQQFIQQLIKHDPSDIDTILRMPEGQDEGVWKYEHLRFVFSLLFGIGKVDYSDFIHFCYIKLIHLLDLAILKHL